VSVAVLPEIVALVGGGVIGRSWSRVFARGGRTIRLYDRDPAQLEAAQRWLEADLARDVADGFMDRAAAAREQALVSFHGDLAAALKGAGFVQESTPEDLAIKQATFRELDRLARPDCILASSTSALSIEEITKGLPGARRSIMTHPFNPPHAVPAVEILATPATEPAVVERTVALMKACGQVPVMVKRYVPGFVGNRIQAAMVREALHLVEQGIAEPEDVDAVLRDGLALRWVTIGNFGANHTNADGGIVEYFTRYRAAFVAMMNDLDSAPPTFDAATLARIGAMVERREGVKDVAALGRKRDVLVRKVLRLRRAEGGS
jgi:3-hydroxyacyl-CoA dehydrogenase